MKIPKIIKPLIQDGLVDERIRQIMSCNEANLDGSCGEDICGAKVYTEGGQHCLPQSITYAEGGKVKDSRHTRAIGKGTCYGRKAQEQAWQSAKANALPALGMRCSQAVAL